jgi:dolichyl-phosphate beta-glucosyltransferase
MQISVVIPCYNETEVIEETIKKVKSFLQKNYQSFEILIIDDKSTDNTLEIIKKINNIKILRNLKNHGKGYSIKKGVKAATGDWILFMDADSSTDISELSKLSKYQKDYKLIIGSRALSASEIKIRQSWFKIFLGKLGNLLIKIVLCTNIRDTQCGFKLFDKELKTLFNKLTIDDWGFDFELIWLAKHNNFKIKEVPIIWYNHPDSKVKWYGYLVTLLQVFKVRLNILINKYK